MHDRGDTPPALRRVQLMFPSSGVTAGSSPITGEGPVTYCIQNPQSLHRRRNESLQIANEVIYNKSLKRIQSVKYKETIFSNSVELSS